MLIGAVLHVHRFPLFTAAIREFIRVGMENLAANPVIVPPECEELAAAEIIQGANEPDHGVVFVRDRGDVNRHLPVQCSNQQVFDLRHALLQRTDTGVGVVGLGFNAAETFCVIALVGAQRVDRAEYRSVVGVLRFQRGDAGFQVGQCGGHGRNVTRSGDVGDPQPSGWRSRSRLASSA